MSNYDQQTNPEEPYSDINFDAIILNLTLSPNLQEGIRQANGEFWSKEKSEK